MCPAAWQTVCLDLADSEGWGMKILWNRALEALWVRMCKWRIRQLEAMQAHHMSLADDQWYDTAGHRNFANEAARLAQMLREEIV